MENKYNCDAYENRYCYCLGRVLTDEEDDTCEDCCCATELNYMNNLKRDCRECANCGRFNKEDHGCGKYVYDCMKDGDAYSNWIPNGKIKNI